LKGGGVMQEYSHFLPLPGAVKLDASSFMAIVVAPSTDLMPDGRRAV
jgi:hypothetical protein